jgi:ubiquinol-cytochrome c reductase cytochrome b subunit
MGHLGGDVTRREKRVREQLLDWLDSRTGYRALLDRALNEPLPRGTGWTFTTGSVLTMLIGIQFVTGVVLAMYYVPAPSLAYDSVLFIMRDLPFGWLVRGLHFWGASFLVVASLVHLFRAFLSGAYKAPREVTWHTGLVLLLLILGFALSGYLLPWDQKAYWATTVTINVARGTPLVGDLMARLLRGGPELGALTLGRWFSAHVLLLPATLVTFIVAHIYLMRRHGISGPIRPSEGPGHVFFPWHVIKDTVMMAAVFASLITMAILVRAPLDEIANPADASYVPRPEWYFLSLFQLLKYFPGPLEPVATIVIPGLVFGFLFLLPFIDRSRHRDPVTGGRWYLTLVMLVTATGAGTLTFLGLRDRPPMHRLDDWGLLPIAGLQIATKPDSSCARCHEPGGPAAPLSITRLSKDEEWLLSHMADPVAIAPGVRSAVDPAPKPVMSRFQAQAVVSYLRHIRAGATPPAVGNDLQLAATTFANICVVCHKMSEEGGSVGPDLTHVGSRRDAAAIRDIIEDASMVYGESTMPTFKNRLSAEQITALVNYLAARK